MADEGKGVSLVILGIVAVVALVSLVMLFRGGATGAALGQAKGCPSLDECNQLLARLPADLAVTCVPQGECFHIQHIGGGGGCSSSNCPPTSTCISCKPGGTCC